MTVILSEDGLLRADGTQQRPKWNGERSVEMGRWRNIQKDECSSEP